MPPAPSFVFFHQSLVVLKSLGLPKKSHCSPLDGMELISPVPLKSVLKSFTPQGKPVWRFTIELTDQPSRICPGVLRPGMAYVAENVKWWRMSNGLLPYRFLRL